MRERQQPFLSLPFLGHRSVFKRIKKQIQKKPVLPFSPPTKEESFSFVLV